MCRQRGCSWVAALLGLCWLIGFGVACREKGQGEITAVSPTFSPTTTMTRMETAVPPTHTASPTTILTHVPSSTLTSTVTPTPRPTQTPTTTPFPNILLTPATPAAQNETYQLIEWSPEHANKLIQLMENYVQEQDWYTEYSNC